MESKFFVNRIIQRGIYYFELSQESKTRPYLVISKDDGGYGAEILAFSITEQFTTKEVNLPLVINGRISFIRVSAALEVPKKKIIKSSFDGLLREDIFDIALRMYIKRFQEIDEEKLMKDLVQYLDELTNLRIPLYVNSKIIFNKKNYFNGELAHYENKDAKILFKKKEGKKKKKEFPVNIKKTQEMVKEVKDSLDENQSMEDDILKKFSINILIKFQNDMKTKKDNELRLIFSINDVELMYMKENIRNLIKKKEKRNQSERKRKNARNSEV